MKPWLGEEEAEAAAQAVRSGWVAQGPRGASFEEQFAARVGAPFAVATSSCTTGLHLALKAIGVGPGDEVIVPSLSFIATANAAVYVGATPVFADIDTVTLNLTAETIRAVMTPATRAVIVVHQAGAPADMPSVQALCDAAGVAIVEDAACAIGSTLGDVPIGASSNLAVFSFHPRKIITCGEGGMVTTRDAAIASRLRRLREHGMNVSAAERHKAGGVVLESYLETGFNFRMTDIQAAVGLVQLSKLDQIIGRRRELGLRYLDELGDLQGVSFHRDPLYGSTNFQSFWVLLPGEGDGGRSRNEVLAGLADRGISGRRGIMAAHLEPAYERQPHAPLPVTERITNDSLILPLFHTMTGAEQTHVIQVTRGLVQERTG